MESRQFGTLLRRHRTRARLTQQELADFSTLSVRAIRDLELGNVRRPRQDTVRLLAEVLRLDGHAREGFDLASRGETEELASARSRRPCRPRRSSAGRGTPSPD
jgi:transcriptional regulator with XRE-family HTH domain